MGLKDDLSKMDLSVAGPRISERPRRPHGSGALPAPTALMQGMAGLDDLKARASKTGELEAQLTAARQDLAQWEGAKAARMLDAKQVVRSNFANRDPRSFESADFRELKEEIANAGGNVQPIKVRSIAGSPSGQARYELVYGHRRHQACLELGLPILALVDELDDRALFIEMDRENRSRKDLSAWEQGVMYARAIDSGLYPSNRKLAEAVGRDLSDVGKAISLARLPAAAIEAFSSPLALQFRWAKPLNDAHQADPAGFGKRAQVAKAEGGKLTAAQVFELLIGSEERGVGPSHPPPVSLKRNGKKVGSLTFDAKGGVSIHFSPGALTPAESKAIAKGLEALLNGAG